MQQGSAPDDRAGAHKSGCGHGAISATVHNEMREGREFLRRHGWRLLILFGAAMLPLWTFVELAEDLREHGGFGFDLPIQEFVRAQANPALDRLALLASKIGYEYGVVPFDVLLVIALAARRRFRESIFAATAVTGSALLNMAAKQLFARPRPDLWESLAPEHNFSFPSGHAMGSMTLAAVVVLLAWRTRWRWPVLIAMLVSVPVVGWSRVYLGVHYPSDIMAGWAAALAWTVGCYAVAFYGHLRPWQLRRPR